MISLHQRPIGPVGQIGLFLLAGLLITLNSGCDDPAGQNASLDAARAAALAADPAWTPTADQTALAAQKIVPRFGVAEFDLQGDQQTARTDNPFQDFAATANLYGPGGRYFHIDGFFDGDNTWRFRFAPRTEGIWKVEMQLELANIPAGSVAAPALLPVGTAYFECKGVQGHGFLRRATDNPYRFQWEDGTPFYPVGIQPGTENRPGLDGPVQGQGPWRSVDFETYLKAFDGAANLFRIQLGHGGSKDHPAPDIITGADGTERYSLKNARRLDHALTLLRAHGYAVILTPFEDMSMWDNGTRAFGPARSLTGFKDLHNTAAVQAARAYVKYLVARYAALIDVWEIFNEDATTPDPWLRAMAAFIHARDPEQHLMTTCYQRPLEPWVDFLSCHDYMWMPDSEVDLHMNSEFAWLKSFNKPVLFTEFGNQGFLSNVDPVKWRIAVWDAFIHESGVLFWHMGGIQWEPLKPGQQRYGNANAYLGPEARQYFRVFLSIVKNLPTRMRPILTTFAGRNENLTRTALSDGQTTILYVHHNYDHTSASKGDLYLWLGRGLFKFTWIDPADGTVLKTAIIPNDMQVLLLPVTVQIDRVAVIQKLSSDPTAPLAAAVTEVAAAADTPPTADVLPAPAAPNP